MEFLFLVAEDRQCPSDAHAFAARQRHAIECVTSFEENLDIGICPVKDNVIAMARQGPDRRRGHVARSEAGACHSASDLLDVEDFPWPPRKRRRSLTYTNLDTFNTVNVIQTFLERSRSEHSN